MKYIPIFIILSFCFWGCYSSSGYYLESYKPRKSHIACMIDKKDSIHLNSDLIIKNNVENVNSKCEINNNLKYFYIYDITVYTPFKNKNPNITVNSIIVTVNDDTVPTIIHKEFAPLEERIIIDSLIDSLPVCVTANFMNYRYMSIYAEICMPLDEIDRLCVTYQIVINNKIITKKHKYRKYWYYYARPWGNIFGLFI